MHEQFRLLLELQQLDDRMQALRAEQDQLPQRLQSYEASCAAARTALAQCQVTIEQYERQQRVLERDVVAQQDAIRKTQSKLHDVKTNKEYSAVLLEVASGKQRLGALEDQILALMESTDEQRQVQQAQEQHVQTAVQELAIQQQRVQQAHALLTCDLTATQTRRQQLIAHLDAALHAQYQKVAARHHGRAVARLQNGGCEECSLKVPPQLISEIRLQTRLFTCPHCRLLLLWPSETSQDEEDEMIAARLQRGEESPGSIEQGAG